MRSLSFGTCFVIAALTALLPVLSWASENGTVGCRGAQNIIEAGSLALKYKEAIKATRVGSAFDYGALPSLGHEDPPPTEFIRELRDQLRAMHSTVTDHQHESTKQTFEHIRALSSDWIRQAKRRRRVKDAVLAGHVLEIQAISFLYASAVHPYENVDHLEEIGDALSKMRSELFSVASLLCLDRTAIVLKVIVNTSSAN